MSCYWCQLKPNNVLPKTVGNIDDPIGCCYKCQVFSCGFHAQRDDDINQYLCFKCDTRKLAMSAYTIAHETKNEKLLYYLHNIFRVFSRIIGDDYYKSYDDFRKRRYSYGEWFYIIEKYGDENEWENFEIRELFSLASYDVRLLLISAAVILLNMEIDLDNQDTILNKLLGEIKLKGGHQLDRV